MAENSDAMSRVQGIIQGVMAGISFVGAGVILRNAQAGTVEGLTTAATVWLSAALGVPCVLGAWKTIAVAVPLSLLLLFAVSWLEQPWKRSGRPGDQATKAPLRASVPVVFAAIELQRDTLCALIDHGLGRTMDDVMEGIDAVIAHVALFASNHALDLRDFARAEIADRGVVKVFHAQLPGRAS